MRIVSGFSDIRNNKEDFVLTPFLFLVFLRNPKIIKVYGIGLCWFYWSFYVGVKYNKK